MIVREARKQAQDETGVDLSHMIRLVLYESLPEAMTPMAERALASYHPEVAPPLQLESKYYERSINITAKTIASDIIEAGAIPFAATLPSAAMLLISAWETTVPFHDHGPLWEFLFHCRNAAAHNGHFSFKNNQPRYPAEWGAFKIERAMQGTRLLQVGAVPGLLAPFDPIGLLWEIERAYPNMTV